MGDSVLAQASWSLTLYLSTDQPPDWTVASLQGFQGLEASNPLTLPLSGVSIHPGHPGEDKGAWSPVSLSALEMLQRSQLWVLTALSSASLSKSS